MPLLTFISGSFFGFLFNHLTTRDGSRLNRKLPTVKIKFVQISPHLKITIKGRIFHLHHWLTYTVVLVITLTTSLGFLDTIPSKGFLVGGILQGFTFNDWKRIVIKK